MALNRNYVLVLCSLIFLGVHWISQLHGTYGLMFDEAQYWYWGKHPAWGYYSKPPMIGWLIAASTAMLGDGNFGVRMFSPILLLLTGFVLHATARRLDYSPRIAAWVFITYLTLPVITGNATFFTTDVPLQLCWAVGLYGVVMALRMNKPGYWLLVGVAAGLGLLSKYTMIAFGASALLAILLTPASRQQLRSAWLWTGGALAGLILVPNLIWNAHHHFVTFNHTNDNVFSKHVEIYPEDMFAFMGAQFGIFGPILLVALVASIASAKRSESSGFLHCFVWPLAIAGILVSLLAGAQAHWIAPVYLAGTLIVVPWLAQRKPALLRVSLVLHIVVLVLFYAAPTIIPHLGLKRDPLVRIAVWNELAEKVRPLVMEHPQAEIMTNERKIAAAFTYSLRDLRGAEPVYKWKADGVVRDHYDLVTEQKDFSGKQLLLVMRCEADQCKTPRRDAKLLQTLKLQKYQFAIYLLPANGRVGYDPS